MTKYVALTATVLISFNKVNIDVLFYFSYLPILSWNCCMLYLGYPEYIIQPGAIKTIFFQSFALNLAGDLANLLAVTYVIMSFVFIATLFWGTLLLERKVLTQFRFIIDEIWLLFLYRNKHNMTVSHTIKVNLWHQNK